MNRFHSPQRLRLLRAVWTPQSTQCPSQNFCPGPLPGGRGTQTVRPNITGFCRWSFTFFPTLDVYFHLEIFNICRQLWGYCNFVSKKGSVREN